MPANRSARNNNIVLSLDEAMRVADHAAGVWPGYRGPILVAAGAGLRWGEMAALTPADVDLESGLKRVDKALSEVAGDFEIKEPKTRASKRVAVFHSQVGQALRDPLASTPSPICSSRARAGEGCDGRTSPAGCGSPRSSERDSTPG